MDGDDDSVADKTGEGIPSPPTHPRSLAQGPRAQRKHTHPPTGATATEPLAAASPAMGGAALGDVLQAVDEELGSRRRPPVSSAALGRVRAWRRVGKPGYCGSLPVR